MKNLSFSMTLLLMVALSLLAGGTAQAQEFKIIVNSDNPTDSLSKSELSKIFLKKRSDWEDGSNITPVDLDVEAIREAFSNEILGKSTRATRSYWQKQIFSGKESPPLELDSDAKVIEFVKSNSGAIGYVSAAADISEVKVLEVK